MREYIPEPPEAEPVYCPVCGEECGELYITLLGEVAGCDNCVRVVDAYDYKEENA